MHNRRRHTFRFAAFIGLVITMTAGMSDAQPRATGDVTFSKDIAPILQRSCQHCHRPESVAPMSLLTYAEARPWARAMKSRTALREQLRQRPAADHPLAVIMHLQAPREAEGLQYIPTHHTL